MNSCSQCLCGISGSAFAAHIPYADTSAVQPAIAADNLRANVLLVLVLIIPNEKEFIQMQDQYCKKKLKKNYKKILCLFILIEYYNCKYLTQIDCGTEIIYDSKNTKYLVRLSKLIDCS